MTDKKKNPSRSQTAATKARDGAKDQPTARDQSAKGVKVVAREERKEQSMQASKPVKRESKGSPAWLTRLNNSKVGRFVREAYYELRHKVTWPTFEEARNMTIAVIVLSAVVGAILVAADFGLYHLFLLISGGS
jgi:preprotein translocase subunit SecE